MSGNIQYELRLLFASFFTGIGLLMVYDCIRVFRILFAHRSFWVGMEDMLYWIYSSLIVFTLLYRENDGNLRAYAIASVFLGMVLYQWLISRKLLKCLKKWTESFKMKSNHFRRQKKQCKNRHSAGFYKHDVSKAAAVQEAADSKRSG